MKPSVKSLAIAWLASSGALLPVAPHRGYAAGDDKQESIGVETLAGIEAEVWSRDEGDLSHAENALIRWTQLHPRSSEAHYLLAYLYARRFAAEPTDGSLLRQASILAEQSLELDPKSDYGYVAMALVLDQLGSEEKASAILKQAAAAGIPQSWRMRLLLLKIQSSKLSPSAISNELEAIAAIPKINLDLVVPFVISFVRATTAPDDLLGAFDRWQRKIPHPLFKMAQAMALAKMEKFPQAHQRYQDFIHSTTDSKEAVIADAALLYDKLSRSGEAIKNLESLLSTLDMNSSAGLRMAALLNLGNAYLRTGNAPKARSSFLLAMRNSADRVRLANVVATAYRQAQAEKDLAIFLQQLNTEIPGQASFYAMLGQLSIELKDFESAQIALESAIILAPERSEFYNFLGLTFYKMNRLQDALGLFNTASQMDPRQASAIYNQACMLSLLGRSDEALSALESALIIDPSLRDSARKDDDFRSLHAHPRFLQVILPMGKSEAIPSH